MRQGAGNGRGLGKERGRVSDGRRKSASAGVTRFAGRLRIVRGSHTISCEYPAPVAFFVVVLFVWRCDRPTQAVTRPRPLQRLEAQLKGENCKLKVGVVWLEEERGRPAATLVEGGAFLLSVLVMVGSVQEGQAPLLRCCIHQMGLFSCICISISRKHSLEFLTLLLTTVFTLHTT